MAKAAAKKGGTRANAGRKPVKEKVEPLTIYKKPSVIKAAGGRDAVRALMSDIVDKAAEKKKPKS